MSRISGVDSSTASTSGTYSRPSVTSSAIAAGAASCRPSAPAVTTASARPTGSGRRRADTSTPPASPTPSSRLSQKIGPPVGDGEHGGAGQRPEHRSRLLDRAHDPERDRAALRRPAVGDQRERGGHQSPGADALQAAPGDGRSERVSRGREQRPEGEQQEAADEDRRPAAEVGQSAEQGQGRGVAQEEAADDRRRPLQLVEPDADPGQDVGQRQDDDVGVGRGDEDGQRGEDDDGEPRCRAGLRRGLSRWAAR